MLRSSDRSVCIRKKLEVCHLTGGLTRDEDPYRTGQLPTPHEAKPPTPPQIPR